MKDINYDKSNIIHLDNEPDTVIFSPFDENYSYERQPDESVEASVTVSVSVQNNSVSFKPNTDATNSSQEKEESYIPPSKSQSQIYVDGNSLPKAEFQAPHSPEITSKIK